VAPGPVVPLSSSDSSSFSSCACTRTRGFFHASESHPILWFGWTDFYGARGSCPCSGSGYCRYGGNTAERVVRTDGGELIVLDLGTGLRELGVAISSGPSGRGPPVRATALLTHACTSTTSSGSRSTPPPPPGLRVGRLRAAQSDGHDRRRAVRPRAATVFSPFPLQRPARRTCGSESSATATSSRSRRQDSSAPESLTRGRPSGFRIDVDGRASRYLPIHQHRSGRSDR